MYLKGHSHIKKESIVHTQEQSISRLYNKELLLYVHQKMSIAPMDAKLGSHDAKLGSH